MLEKAIQWIKNNSIPGQGIVVSSRNRVSYPEVTGYLIPTLYLCGERELANRFARWLVTIQKPDGSIPAPGDDNGYAFDTGQVIRGWVAALPLLPELEQPLRKACNWIVTQSSTDGRLPVPESNWSMDRRGSISESVHLYALVPLLTAGELLAEPRFSSFARTGLDYYLHNTDLTGFRRPNMLTHLFAYIQEALFDLGAPDVARRGMQSLEPFQQPCGGIPAYFDAEWICTPGQIQSAIVWYKLGEYERANRALAFIEKFINSSGGFFGSYGVGAEYFATEEISWANKFYLDVAWMRIQRFFDKEESIFPDKVSLDDGRLGAIVDYAGDLNGKRVLDVGCGKGRFAVAIRQLHPQSELTGLDVSEKLLECVPSDINTRRGSMLDMPFEDDTFDVVYCIEALEHAVRIEQAVAEMCRVLRPGGQIVIIDKNSEHWGVMQTPHWEQWFTPAGLTELIKRYCNTADWQFIGYDGHDASDHLFVAWRASKQQTPDKVSLQSPAVEKSTTAPETSSHSLDAHQWHESIVGTTRPEQIAEKVRRGQVPEWINPLLENTQVGDSVLELGSGSGELSAFLASEGRQVVLIDYSQESLDFSEQVFKELGLSARFIRADVSKELPLPDNHVDMAWSSGLLEHFDDEEIVHILSESARVSRNKVISLVPNANSIPYRLGKWQQEQSRQWKWGYEDPKSTMVDYFKKVGLQNIQEYSVAPKHSNEFLLGRENLAVAKNLNTFFESLSPAELQQLNQGYLLATIGCKHKLCRFAIVPNDPFEAGQDNGYDHRLNDGTKGLRILYYGAGWPTNIGNAFIDLGAMSILRAAAPNAQISFASEMPRWFFGQSATRPCGAHNQSNMDKALDIASVTDCDLVVIAGMAMCEEFVRVNGPSLLTLSHRGVPVLLLGTGGLTYSEKEITIFNEFLKELKPIGFISRDDWSHETFAATVPNSHKGIDCAFFLPEAYKPFPLLMPAYVVATFDSVREPDLDLCNQQLIRAHHECWFIPNQHFSTNNTLISDIPYDYLTLYANAEEVHTDRVHACVAALAYGRKAKFYHPTPRGSLFSAVGAEEIRDKLLQLDIHLLEEKKMVQIKLVKKLLTSSVLKAQSIT